MGRALQVGQRSSAFTCMCHSQELGGGGVWNTLSKVFAVSEDVYIYRCTMSGLATLLKVFSTGNVSSLLL